MRAVAVLAVLAFHAELSGFAGGFVGVDVFFVLSGFLITRLLLSELARTGTISLSAFWARRARRLLPASALVIVVTLVAARWMLPPLSLRSVTADAIGAATFVVNLVFAGRLGDYFGGQLGELQPSPFLHFWSLSLEEQFYLVWPVALVALARRPRQLRRLLLIAIGAVAAVSLGLSIAWTRTNPTWAFYLLPPRMVELLAGAAVAVAGPAFAAVPPRFRALLGWWGVTGILAAVVLYDSSTAFPGTAAMLPVLATVLVLAAGGRGSDPRGPARLLAHPVGQWIGARSYAIYLWHWPALVLIDARFGPLSTPARVGVVVASVGVAALTYRVVEDPVRHDRWLAAAPARGVALGAALCAVALMTAGLVRAGLPALSSDATAAAPTLAVRPLGIAAAPVAGGGGASAAGGAVPTTVAPVAPAPLPQLTGGDLPALIAANQSVLADGAGATEVPSNLRPSLADAVGDRAPLYADDCVNVGVDQDVHPCRYGPAGAATTIVLFGDSHAAQWFPAVLAVAEARGAELVVLAKGGCPVAAVSIPTNTLARTCPAWRDAAIQFIAAAAPDVVLTTSWADYPNGDEEWEVGFDQTVARLAATTPHLIVLGDNPPAEDLPSSCLSAHVHSADECVADRADVVNVARLAVEQRVAAARGATFVDPTDWFCTPTRCPVMIGDILIYRDATHITSVAASWFQPLLAAALAPAFG